MRRQLWRVVRTQAAGDIVELAAARRPTSLERSFLTRFEVVEPADPPAAVRHASTRRWRRAVRHLIASTAPPGGLRALAGARLSVLPHQLAPALAVVRGIGTRLLLADDVGLGKTIESGIILAELRERGVVRRALVLTPAGLRDQWQAELCERFGIDVQVVDAGTLAAAAAEYAANPWLSWDVVVASIDLVKRPEHLGPILQCAWDLLIVDEAHNAVGDSDRHHAIDTLASRTPFVVLATATPHNGDRAAFASLCSLGRHDDPCIVFRRTRGDVKLAGDRHARRLTITPTSAERRMHDALAAFSDAVFRERHGDDRGAALALAVLHKRALSSAEALRRSALRRLEALAVEDDAMRQPALPFDDLDGEIDDGDQAPAWSGGPILADAGRERDLLSAVARAAENAVREGESKLRLLARWLRRVREPAIVFTEYRDTVRHIAEVIGSPSVQLHGGLTAPERRAALRTFRAGVPILLATDAAGEGLNLHERCRIVINLELPWNPVRLEQRIGRVDRIGQSRTVHALTLVAAGTAEERILERLRARVARAHHDLGAADPLGLLTEADVRRFVLGLDDAAGEHVRIPSLTMPVLDAEAAAEAERLQLVRRLASATDVDGELGTLVGVTHKRATRVSLGPRALVLVELAVEDGTGSIVERALIPLTVADSPPETPAIDLDRMLEHAVVTASAERLAASARSLAAARVVRERVIAAATARTPITPMQSGLFDRRSEHDAAAASAASDAARAALECRRATAEAAALRIATHVSIRLVLRVAR